MDILEKLKSQIGDDPQYLFDTEALFMAARDEITRLRARVTELTEERNVQNDLRQIAEDTADMLRAQLATAQADALAQAAEIALRHLSKVQINEPLWHDGQDWAAQRIADAIRALKDAKP